MMNCLNIARITLSLLILKLPYTLDVLKPLYGKLKES